MCVNIHQSVVEMSKQFLAELSRHNYVTPTSYLELLGTFSRLLKLKSVMQDTELKLDWTRYVRIYTCMSVCMYVCMYIHTHTCMYVCMYVHTYIWCMDVWMYVDTWYKVPTLLILYVRSCYLLERKSRSYRRN